MRHTTRVYGIQVLEGILQHKPHIVQSLWMASRDDQRMQTLRYLVQQHGIPIQKATAHSLDKLSQNGVHQGVVADIQPDNLLAEQDIPNHLSELGQTSLILLLDGIQDPHNLGACLRSAEAAGVDLVIMPKDRAAGLTSIARRTACGAAELLPIAVITNLARVIETCQSQGFWVIGTSDAADTSLYPGDSQKKLAGKIAIVMGNEGSGLRQLTQKRCDELRYLPMAGTVSSLNVSVATGICLFEIRRQQEQ